MSFSVDLATSEGKKAYSDLVGGNIAGIQDLATKKSTAVKFQEKSKLKQIGKFHNAFIGIPLLAFSTWSNGNIYEVSSSQDITSNTQANSKYSVYIKEQTKSVMLNKNSKVESFYGASVHVTKKNTDKSALGNFSEKFGQYVLSYQSDKTEPISFKKIMKQITTKTGFDDVALMNIPNVDDLGFMKIDFKVTLSGKNTENLLNAVASFQTPQDFVRTALSIQQDYFNYRAGSKLDDQNVCEKLTGDADEVCNNQLKKKTIESAVQIHAALIAMYKANKSMNEQEFIKAYSDLGKAMLMNQFAFQMVLKMAGDNVLVHFKVESQEFSKVDNEYRTTSNRDEKSGKFILAKVQSKENEIAREDKAVTNTGFIILPTKKLLLTP
jgi:hypothetical protein